MRPSVDVQVGGSFTGQLAAGSDNTQVALNINVGDAAGDTLAFLDRALGIERIAPPVDARPSEFPELFGRDPAVAAAERPVAPPWIGVVGPPGIGKSVLLRHLAGRWGLARQPDGLVYLPAAGMVDLDVAYALFDLFYRTRPRGRPSRGELVASLAAVKAVVLLDDVDDVHLADTLALMRGTTFVVAGQRAVLTEGTRVVLSGLDPAASVHLVERGLGRRLEPGEQADAARLVNALHGIPADIIREASDAAVEGRTLAEVVARIEGPAAAAPVEVLTEGEHAVVLAAAALGGVPVGREHLGAITGAPDAVAALERRAIVRAASPTLVLDSSWLARLAGQRELAEWHSRWLDYFASWASNSAPAAADVSAEAPALAHLLGPTRFGIDPKRSKVLVRAILPALTLTSRFGLRRRLLELVVASVDTAQEPEGGAWALHQLGTQDALEGRLTEARDNLTRAHDIRQRLGDLPGLKATEQNLAVLDALGPPLVRTRTEEKATQVVRDGAGSSRALLWAAAAGLLIVAAAVIGFLLVNAASATAASVSPGNLNFATAAVGDRTEEETVRITAGSRPLHITNVRIDQSTGFEVTSARCTGAQLAPGTTCDEQIVFAPVREGSARAALLISVEGSDAPLQVTLVAEGRPASASPSQAVAPPSVAPSSAPPSPSTAPSTGPANLVIRVLELGEPRHEADGWHVPVTVEIVNGGDSDAPPFEVALLRDVKGSDVIPFTVEGQATPVPATTAPLAPGAPATLTGFALLPSELTGDIRIDVEADSCAIANPQDRTPCRIVETREDDNSFGAVVSLGRGPDLVIREIERADGSEPDPDGGVRHGSYVAVVANTGNVDAGESLVQVAVQGGDAKMERAPLPKVGPLTPGQEETIKGSFDFFYAPGSAGTPELTLTVDPCDVRGGCQVNELNEQNNTTTRAIDFGTSPQSSSPQR